MASAHRAIALDTLHRAKISEGFDTYIVVTDTSDVFFESPQHDIIIEPSRQPFHFGGSLRDLVVKHHLERVCYVGGGAMPLLSSEELARISRQLSTARDTVITNNIYSGDLVAFTPGSSLDKISLPSIDNPLPQILHSEAGLKAITLPKGISTLLDVDTPTDLAILRMYPDVGPHLRAYLDSQHLDTGRLARALAFFTDPHAEVLVAGRVSSYVWSRLEEETACRCRVISEERGMRADGREGAVRSILGQQLELVSPHDFFLGLSELADAAFIDTRVLFRHLRLRLSASDRFLSDMMRSQDISDPWLREITQAAKDAPIPVVLGGHSLVTGGLLALIEIAWATSSLVDKK